MTQTTDPQDDRPTRRISSSAIEAIESGYEFMLAYAAQGRETDKGAGSGRQRAEYLERMATSLDGLARSSRRAPATSLDRSSRNRAARSSPLSKTDRARHAQAAVRLVLARPT